MNALILGLDISSSAIGYVIRNSAVVTRGVIRLDAKSDISERCLMAKNAIENLLMQHAVDAVAIESPVARFASAIIPQARVSGVILLAVAEQSLMWCEVAPQEAKLALAEDGAATKLEMLMAAAWHFSYRDDALAYTKVRGEWCALCDGAVVFWEHEADALGVAMAAERKVQVVE